MMTMSLLTLINCMCVFVYIIVYLFFQVIQVASVSDQNDNIKDEMPALDGSFISLLCYSLFILFYAH